MPPRTTTKRPSASLRQSSLSFASKRSTAAGAGSKGSFLKSLSTTPIAGAPRTPEPRTADDLDVIEVFDDAEPFVEEIDISDSDEEYAPTASKRGGAGRKAKVEDIDDSEEPPKKKRRTSARKVTVKDTVEPADDSDVPIPKGKGKQRAAAKKSLKQSVFRSREGVENSDREGGKATPDWKITVKGSQDTSGHVNREELLRHFGEVRERMGNVKPIHADKQTMEDHILRVFDLSYEYGPCIGVTRLQRWTRADVLGLNPPPVVKQLLTNQDGSEKDDVKQCVFFGEV